MRRFVTALVCVVAVALMASRLRRTDSHVERFESAAARAGAGQGAPGVTISSVSPDAVTRSEASGRPVVLRRFPDEKTLSGLSVRFDSLEVGEPRPWQQTDAGGSVVVAFGGESVLRLRAPGYQSRLVDESEREILLRPSSGVHGSVLLPSGAPAEAAKVILVSRALLAWGVSSITASAPEVTTRPRLKRLGECRTDAEGSYFCETPGVTGPVTVSMKASGRDGVSGEVLFNLEPGTLCAAPDIVLTEEQRRLVVRVLTIDGRPLGGVSASDGVLEPAVTDAEGLARIDVTSLPARIYAWGADSLRIVEERHDGRSVARGTRIESADTEVTFIAVPSSLHAFELVDSVTELGIPGAQVWVRWLADDLRTVLDYTEIQTDENGIGEVSFLTEAGKPCPRVILSARHQAYDSDQEFVMEPVPIGGPTPVFRVAPIAGTSHLKGTALRSGVAVRDQRLTVAVMELDQARQTRAFSTRTDAHGRFSVPVPYGEPPVSGLSAFVYFAGAEEFALLGPLELPGSLVVEHVLEFVPAARVPIHLRGGAAEGRFFCFVNACVGGGDGPLIGSEPFVTSYHDGVGDAIVALPRHFVSRVSVRSPDGYQLLGGPIRYDPMSEGELPVIDVGNGQSNRDISGYVLGFEGDDVQALAVGLCRPGDRRAELVMVESDATFTLRDVAAKDANLILFRLDEAASRGTALACMEIKAGGGDLKGIAMSPDTTSLPE